MSVRVLRSRSPEQQAQEVVGANLHALEKPVLRAVKGRLVRENIGLPEPDLEAAYNQAWHGVYETIAQGRQVDNLTGLLIDITYKRSVDIYRQRHEAMHSDAVLDDHAADVDLAEQIDDQRKIDRLMERLIERLNTNERNAVTLCVMHGYKRPEAAQRLGIPEVAFQKIMDSATKKIAGIVTGMQARGCGGEEWARALRAFALGLTGTDSPDYERVTQHIDECASCKRYVMGLRGLAAVLPPIMPLGHDIAALLAHLYKLFAPAHGAVTTGASTAQSTAAVAGATAAGSTAVSGGGLSGVLGGGAIKAAVLVAGIAATGTLSVGLAVHHHTPRAHLATSSPSSSPMPTSLEANLLATDPARSYEQSRAQATRRKHDTKTRRGQAGATASEFGFEGSRPTTPQPVAPTATTTSPPAQPSPSEESSGREFSFENASRSK